ncbi:MAG TPA: biotin/lipoyl-containing protein, partial [Thermoanaerobaculia bacterium]
MAVTKVVMPKLSEAMETGKVIKWIKKEGDRINGGDILAEIETDKADVEMEAFGAGVLRKILVKEGEQAPVGGLIAVIAEPNEDISSVVGSGAPAAPAPAAAGNGKAATAAAPSARPTAVPPQPKTEDHATVAKTEPAAKSPAGTAAASAPSAAVARETGVAREHGDDAQAPAGSPGRVKASPLARKVAAQSGVDLQLVRGSGPGGRIVRKDVEAAASTESAGARADARPHLRAREPAGPEFEDRPLSQMRAIIAKRMPLSKAPVPHFYVTTEVAMDRAWELREQLNALDGQPKISVNDLVVRACALALLD